jgi:hypothetical protein
MHEMVYYFLGGAVAAIGLFMAILPKIAVKKESKGSDKAIKGARIRGLLLVVVGILIAVMPIIFP